MRCVFDTNVIVSALLLSDSKPRLALDHAFQEGVVLISASTLSELYEVLERPKFRAYVSEEDTRLFISVCVRDAEWVQANIKITACRDPKDDKFLEVALSGRATHIITGGPPRSELFSRHSNYFSAIISYCYLEPLVATERVPV